MQKIIKVIIKYLSKTKIYRLHDLAVRINKAGQCSRKKSFVKMKMKMKNNIIEKLGPSEVYNAWLQ